MAESSFSMNLIQLIKDADQEAEFFKEDEMEYVFTVSKERAEDIMPYVHSEDFVSAISQYFTYLRTKTKYTDLTDEQDECFNEARTKLIDILTEYSIIGLF